MSDAKKPSPDASESFNLDDLDWDSALAEWEQNTFVPEVAVSSETHEAAQPADAGEIPDSVMEELEATRASPSRIAGLKMPDVGAFTPTAAPAAAAPSVPVAPVPSVAPVAPPASAAPRAPSAPSLSAAPVSVPRPAPSAPSMPSAPPRPSAPSAPSLSTGPSAHPPSASLRASQPAQPATLSANPPRIVPRATTRPRFPTGAPGGPGAPSVPPAPAAPRVIAASSTASTSPPAAPAPAPAPARASSRPPMSADDVALLSPSRPPPPPANDDDDENTALFGRLFRDEGAVTNTSPTSAPPPLVEPAQAGKDGKDEEVRPPLPSTAETKPPPPLVEPELEGPGVGEITIAERGPLGEVDELAFTRESQAAASAPPIHSPPLSLRAYDPDAVTGMLVLADLLKNVIQPSDDAETRMRGVKTSAQDDGAERVARPAPVFEDEAPAATLLDEAARVQMIARARRIEAEARTRKDAREIARGLLVASELFAIAGLHDDATERAIEARQVEPSLALAHVQARALTLESASVGASTHLAALDAEARNVTTLAGQVHALLLGADLARAQGDEEEAAQRWERATRVNPADPRAPIARAARSLSRGDLTTATTDASLEGLPAPIAAALRTALRLRGREQSGPGEAGGIGANDSLRRARLAFEKRDLDTVARQLAEVRSVPELATAATWLASMVGAVRPELRAEATQWLRPLGARPETETAARRALAARALEMGDKALGDSLVSEQDPFTPAERALITLLLGLPVANNESLDLVSETSPALGAALAAVSIVGTDEDPAAARRGRAARAAGSPTTRKLVSTGRLLADLGGADGDDPRAAAVQAAIDDLGADAPESLRAVGIELAVRARRYSFVSDALAAWLGGNDASASPRDRNLAAALVAEVSGDEPRAIAAYHAAQEADRSDAASVRALLTLDLEASPRELLAPLAAERSDVAAGLARLESAARSRGDDAAQLTALEQSQRAAPFLPMASFVGEAIARRAGDIDALVGFRRERRAQATDPLELALIDTTDARNWELPGYDAERTAERLEDAHDAFPDDVALRELAERHRALSSIGGNGDDQARSAASAAWFEKQADAATGEAKVTYLTEAARLRRLSGDRDAALNLVRAARLAGGEGLPRLALDRAELESGESLRVATELEKRIKASEDEAERTELRRRLAALPGQEPEARARRYRELLDLDLEHLPTLRALEHALIDSRRGIANDNADDERAVTATRELARVSSLIAHLTRGSAGGESQAHAQLAVRLHLSVDQPWEETRELAVLSANDARPTLWALRFADAHARAEGDDPWQYASSRALVQRVTEPNELAFLRTRAGEAALRVHRLQEATDLFARATTDDPGDVVAWGRLAEARRRARDLVGAGEALESLAKASLVSSHRRAAYAAAARWWLDEAHDEPRGIRALEEAAAIALGDDELFDRLLDLYARSGQRAELAALLERRLAEVDDPEARAALEVQRGKALAEMGDLDAASQALESALATDANNSAALRVYASIAMKRSDWTAAEQTLVSLARLVADPAEQRSIYASLGTLYAQHLDNLPRAEVAYQEVLKRAPDDVPTLEKLAALYQQQNDIGRAVEVQTQLVSLATDPTGRRARMLEMAHLYEHVAGEPRRAEQVLDAARKEAPLDVEVLRALVDFYQRHRQGPAINVLLDRVGGDARRAIAAGRIVPAQLEQLVVVYELRERRRSAELVSASLRALRGEAASIRGAEGRAFDPNLDELLAPELLSPSLRVLLARTGDALDAATPVDLRAVKAAQLPGSLTAWAQRVNAVALASGVAQLQMLTSAAAGTMVVPCSSTPPILLVGDLLAGFPEGPRTFLAYRALKLAHAHASALIRTPPKELGVLVSAWLQLFNPGWAPQGIAPQALADATRRMKGGIPKQLPPDLSVAALEVAGAVLPHLGQLGLTALGWANRTALLATGDLGAAFDAIALASGRRGGAPTDPQQRTAWITSNAEARDLLAFSVGEAYAEARHSLRLA
jgi:hypothetical protein